MPSCLYGSLSGLAQESFEFGEDLFDWIEIRTVWRQKEELCPSLADGLAHGLTFVAAKIVEDDDIAWLQGGHQELLDIGTEATAIDGTIHDAGGGDFVGPQGGQKGQSLPMSMRHLGVQPLTARATPMRARHVRLGPGLVNKNQTPWIDFILMAPPAGALGGNLRPVLLGGQHGFF